MNTTNLKNALHAANARPYEAAYCSNSTDLAQRQLSGRTHYADYSTLKFFGARINETRQDEDGLWFALRESVQPPHSARVHRWAIFDVFGTCVERTEDRSTGAAADRLFHALVESIDWTAHTLDRIEERAARLEREARAIREALTSTEAAA